MITQQLCFISYSFGIVDSSSERTKQQREKKNCCHLLRMNGSFVTFHERKFSFRYFFFFRLSLPWKNPFLFDLQLFSLFFCRKYQHMAFIFMKIHSIPCDCDFMIIILNLYHLKIKIYVLWCGNWDILKNFREFLMVLFLVGKIIQIFI